MDELDFVDLEAVDELDAEEEEDGVVLDSGESTLRDKDVAHTYPNSLPYVCETQEEFDRRLAMTIGKLLDCIELHDFDVGLVRWNQYLQCLLSLKYPVKREWRAKLARMYYELTVMSSLDPRVTEVSGSTAIRLLRYVALLTQPQTRD